MFKRPGAVVPVCFLVVVLIAAAGRSHAAEKPVYSGPAAAEEMKLLEPFIGEWKSQGTVKPSLKQKEGYTSKGELTAQWMHNGHFLRVEGFGDSELGRFDHTVMITFNRSTRQFRYFAFSSVGDAVEGSGEWDADTHTLTISNWPSLPAGWNAVSTMSIQKDRFIHTLLVKNDKDEVVRDVVTVSERKK